MMINDLSSVASGSDDGGEVKKTREVAKER